MKLKLKTLVCGFSIMLISLLIWRCSNPNSSPKGDDKATQEISENVAIFEYEGEIIPEKIDDKKFEESFLDFFEIFRKNPASQISVINNPLIYTVTYQDESGEIITLKEYWDDTKVNNDWIFWKDEWFFDNTKTTDDQVYQATFYESKNINVYEFGVPNSGFFFRFIFKKIDNKWYLFEYHENFL